MTQQQRGDAIQAELRHSMVAIAAAAFAVDAFYASVVARIPRAPKKTSANRASRAGHITDAFNRGYKLPNATTKELRRSIGVIFKYRGWAVHAPGDYRPTHLHPDLETAVEWRFLAFTAGNAKEIVEGALSIIRALVERPRVKTHTDLAEWSDAMKPWLDERVAACKEITERTIAAD
jgi:hypothetical protein